MARCGCEGLTCACSVQAGTGITVTGIGTGSNPYVISSQRGQLRVADTATVDLTLSGDGSTAQPYFLTADATVHLSDLIDVSLPSAPASGQVLSWNGTQWVAAPPSTAPVGAVHTSGCLAGDGSAGSPLHPTIDPDGQLACNAAGLAASPALLQLLAGLSLQPWNHQWRAETVAMNYGSGPILGEYARWGQLCYVRFAWQGGPGFSGGRDRFFWTLPFPAAGPGMQPIPAYLRLSTGQEIGACNAVPYADSTQMRLLVPETPDLTWVWGMRNGDGSGAGSGWPQIPNTFPLTSSPNSMICFQGWYRIKDGA